MRSRSLIVLAAALFIGLVAVLIANGVFTGVEQRQAKAAEDTRQVRIAVATQDVAFGTPLSAQNVRLANWPASSVPAGAFTTLEDATRARVALRPMVTGEPVLASKVSGENGRATLSANLPAGQLAFAVPIDAVAGAGGFVRPGGKHFRSALDEAHAFDALSYELRIATDLAALYMETGRPDEATGLLLPVYRRFGEGFATRDLMTADAILRRARG